MMKSIKIITDESQVPEGYIRMLDIKRKHGDNARRVISKALHSGKLRAVKLMRTTTEIRGPAFVHRDDADEYLSKVYGVDDENTEINPLSDKDLQVEWEKNQVLTVLRSIDERLKKIEEMWA
jgi:hypothetical protein